MKSKFSLMKFALLLLFMIGFEVVSNAQTNTSQTARDQSKLIATQFNSESDFQISPNPVNQELKIKATFITEGGNVQIINEKGIEVYNGILKNNMIDASKFASGMYLFVYTRDGNKIVKGFVKQ